MKHHVWIRALSAWVTGLLFLGVILPGAAEIHVGQEPPAEWAEKEVLRLTAFATLINDCTLMEVGGKSMLIDGGVRKWREKLTEALMEMGYGERVNIIYNTHPHDDHLQNVTQMMKHGFRADEFWSSFRPDYRNDTQRSAVRELEKAGIPYHQLAQGETVNFGGAELSFYWWEEGGDPNARSSIMHVTFGDATVLMTGDATGAAQQGILKVLSGDQLKADIMKMPHHGLVRIVQDFLATVDPGFIFVTNRKSGSPKATEQMKAAKIPFYNTTGGRVVMVTDGTDWYITQYADMF